VRFSVGGGGGSDAAYTYEQLVASNHWVIDHPLGKRPSVTVIDSAGTVVYGNVSYEGTNRVVVDFLTIFSGFAYLN
jgi:hypothetical protein